MLWLVNCTPGYALRFKIGITKLAATVFKLVLNLIEKILSMYENRYPKLCFLRLKNFSINNSATKKFNWCKQVEYFFNCIDEKNNWENISLNVLQLNKSM